MEAEAIRRLIGWNDPIDTTTIKAYLMKEHREKEFYDTSMEMKRRKIGKEEDVGELINKKKISSNNNSTPREGLVRNTRQNKRQGLLLHIQELMFYFQRRSDKRE